VAVCGVWVTAEETRLRLVLAARDDERWEKREKANAWRRERGYKEWPVESDHLTPIVLLALNTGLRKGEIFNLTWADINLVTALLTVRGEGAKSSQTRYVPLNAEAVTVLRTWHAASGHTGRVFPGSPERRPSGDTHPGDDNAPLDDVKKSWLPIVRDAKLENFTFHDLRHTFASKLVMAGVDLNTVRELLGHADLKMTLRYAHLAPEHKAVAVAKLVAV
jgi:integrase